MNVLVIDIGGTNVKSLASGKIEPRRFPSGRTLTPELMVSGVKKLARGWKYDAISIGYPGVIKQGRIVTEPKNLAPKWVGFDFAEAFGRPVKIMNDAAMQALGSYREGLMLFMGLGTGLGSALVVDGKVAPMELAHLSYKKGSYEDYVGIRGYDRLGLKKWQKNVFFGAERLIAALHPDDVVIGGGNAKKLKKMPDGCRAGDNQNAFIGGFRMWADETKKGKG